MEHQINVELSSSVYGGSAMGRMEDGRAVFVLFALAGERVRARVIEEKSGYLRAELVEVVRPSKERITPRCPHFTVCGGCHYQMVSYEQQLEIKREVLLEQLQRIARISQPPVNLVVPAPQPWNYRNTVQFHLTPEGKVGYQQAGTHKVVAITECYLPEVLLNEIWPQLELEPYPGLDRIELRLGADEEVLLVLIGREPEPPEFEVEIPISAVHLSPKGSTVLAGDDHVVMEVLGRLFYVSADSFFQVNTAQASKMVKYLLENLPLRPDSTVLDVYCGVGLFSAFLAGKVKRCIGVEVNPKACQDYALNLDEFDNVELYQGTAEEVLPAINPKPDVVIVDPPRAGLERRALQALTRLQPQMLAYVSCDPSTLARDTRRLMDAGYRLEQVTPFDLFPQTYHVESISLFRLGLQAYEK